MKRTVGLFLVLVASALYAQRPQGTVEAEAVCYVNDSQTVTLELTYSIQQGVLHYTQGPNGWTAPIPVVAEVWQNDVRIAQQTVTKQSTVAGSKEELAAKSTNLILDKISFVIPAKKNTVAYLIFNGEDKSGKVIPDTLRRLTYTPVQKKDSFVFSGVELASFLQASETSAGSPFYRVGYIMYPNPSLIFGGDYSTLNFYTELNTPAISTVAGDSAEMLIRILDGAQTEIMRRVQMVPLIAPRTPFLGSIDIEALGTDSYSLVITASYKGKPVAAIRKGFYNESTMIVSDDDNDASPAIDDETVYQNSDISKYSDLELAERIDQSGYLMPNDERKAIAKTANAGEKKRMLFKFWRSQDIAAGTAPLQEFRNFLRRVEEANKQFTYQKTIGWKTPRGRIYIAYGAPEFVGGEPFSTESKPYIIWQFYTRRFQLSSGSRAEFVFVDLYGGGNYQLVHSNVRGEVSQPDWYKNEAFRLR